MVEVSRVGGPVPRGLARPRATRVEQFGPVAILAQGVWHTLPLQNPPTLTYLCASQELMHELSGVWSGIAHLACRSQYWPIWPGGHDHGISGSWGVS